MTDTEMKIAAIRESLEKATPGPWTIEGKEIWKREGWYFGDYPHVYICDVDKHANAHLIANAPEWLRFLLDELERLEREYAEERAAHNAHVTDLCELEKENRKLRQERDAYYNNARYTEAAAHGIEKLREENRKLVEALRWYAKLNPAYTGHRAREILKEIGVTVE